MSQRKYYEAYDDRYRQVHDKKLQWFMEEPSGIVQDVLEVFGIGEQARILEVGCGEGRDARYLLNNGYDLLATDVSPEAISWCRDREPRFAERFQVLDCVRDRLEQKFDFIFAVAVIHMLVEDEDRNGFYRFIRNQLSADGIALICSMGDGIQEHQSDISGAFALQERVHEQSGTKVMVVGTSYRAVSFEGFRREMENNGLTILKTGLTEMPPDYWKMMYAVVKKDSAV